MGSPQTIEGADYRRLEAAGKLALMEEQASVAATSGVVKLRLTLPRQGVSLIRLE
jgi:xylan 1,4-beta-xylosidase